MAGGAAALPPAMIAGLLAVLLGLPPVTLAGRQAERLDRGLVALAGPDGAALVSWRLLATDPPGTTFRLYRRAGGDPLLVYTASGDRPTCFVDPAPGPAEYAVAAGDEPPGPFVALSLNPYLEIPLRTPDGYQPNDASVGDLDGDGALEIVLHQAGVGRDNAQAGRTDPPLLEAYRLDGTRLWRIDLGRNLREGAHYTQFLVYDFDGDGRAEVACKTADGTTDGTGAALGTATADWRNDAGYVLAGPEWLTVFDGATGRALATVPYVPPRGDLAAWGDAYGNRVDRFLAAVAYLDGARPSLVMVRGYYTRTAVAAWDLRDGRLTARWLFDSAAEPDGRRFEGQGNHNLAVGDVDGDGRDEIVLGALVIDDDGRPLHCTGLGHGDALHLADIDPDRPGLEIFSIHERPRHAHGAELRDARTGEILWSKPSPDVGRGLAMDLDPRHPGLECWAAGRGLGGLWSARGEPIGERRPWSCNFGVWWDGDPLRELLDGITVSKWQWLEESESVLLRANGCAANNGTKSTPALCADILGDWREEILWRTADGRALRIYSTTIPTAERRVTWLHDPLYRLSVAWQNVGYNLPTQPGAAAAR